MSKRLLNKVSLITGSTDGIGYGIAEKFLKEGSKVIVCSRKPKNVDFAVKELSKDHGNNVHGLVCQVNNHQDRVRLIDETVKKYGKIDILVSNVGTNIQVGNILDCEEETWDKMFDTNVKSAFFLTKLAVPHMLDGGSIIFNLSIAALNPLPMLGLYSITKTTILGMIKVLSREIAYNSDKCIRVNGIAPGIIKTKFSQMFHQSPQLSESIMNDLHIKRFGYVKDCADVATFLASDESSYITGETIVVAGGLQSRL